MVHATMQHVIDEYLTMLQVESGCAVNTLAAYRRDLRKLVDFFQQEGMTDLHALTKPLWVQVSCQLTNSRPILLIDCAMPGVGSGLYKHLEMGQRKATFGSILKGTPKQWVQLPKLLSEAEVTRLLNLPAVDSREDRRDAAMVELLYATGLRVSELVNLEVAHLNLEVGFLKATGKRDKQRIVPIGDKARDLGRGISAVRSPGLCQKTNVFGVVSHPAGSSHEPTMFLENSQGSHGQSRDYQTHLPAHAPAFVRHPPLGSWGGFAISPNDVGPCQHRHHPNLYPCRACTPQKSPR